MDKVREGKFAFSLRRVWLRASEVLSAKSRDLSARPDDNAHLGRLPEDIRNWLINEQQQPPPQPSQGSSTPSTSSVSHQAPTPLDVQAPSSIALSTPSAPHTPTVSPQATASPPQPAAQALSSPTLQRVFPTSYHISGGAPTGLVGFGFTEHQRLRVRFGVGADPVDAYFQFPHLLTCTLPRSDSAGLVFVTLHQREDGSEIQNDSDVEFTYTDPTPDAPLAIFSQLLLAQQQMATFTHNSTNNSYSIALSPHASTSTHSQNPPTDQTATQIQSALQSDLDQPVTEDYFLGILNSSLFQNCDSINLANDFGQNLAHFCVELRYHRLLTAVIERGVDIHAKDVNGWTPLDVARLHHDADAIDILEGEWEDKIEDAISTAPLSIDLLRRFIPMLRSPVPSQPSVSISTSSNMAGQPAMKAILLHLDQITLHNVPNQEYTLRLFVENEERELQEMGNQSWTPAQRQDAYSISKMHTKLQMRSGDSSQAKNSHNVAAIDIPRLLDDYWGSNEHQFMVSEAVVIEKYHGYLEFQFCADPDADSLRSSLRKLEILLKEYNPLMSESAERVMDMNIKYGAAFAEFDPIAKAAFDFATVTFGLLKEQNTYDWIPMGLFNRLQRVLPLADKVADEIVCEETNILEEIIPRMFKVMHRVAEYSCGYVKHGRLPRMVVGLVNAGMVVEMERDLTKVTEEFDRALNVEYLQQIKETEQGLLFERLKGVKTDYDRDFRCAEGTRTFILEQVMDWAINETEQKHEGNIYWIYGSPGIGKTSLAHSICAGLYERERLAGAFFCQRDDAELSEPRTILPNLIHKLAGIFPPFRRVVAACLRNDPNLTQDSMIFGLFVDFVGMIPRPPKHTLVLVIDALDECGDNMSRPAILKAMADAAACAPWLKIIITSRPESDIQDFFDSLVQSSYSRYDLTQDRETTSDLRIFAQTRFKRVAFTRGLESSWPEQSLFHRIISRAAGLFIFIESISLALEHRHRDDPTEYLKATLQDAVSPGLVSLYARYSSILIRRVVDNHAEFQRMIGVLLAAAPYRPLCDETIAELAGVQLNLVKMWVADLSSLLYRDEGANGGIRVRHLSISDFFLSDHCHNNYRVDLREANVDLGTACLRTMVEQLRFNICKLEDSRLPNADVEDLPFRIKANISGALQYSSIYWSNHVCIIPDNGDHRFWEFLRKFFEGPYALFWTEVLSIMGMVGIGVPSLRRISDRVKVVDLTLAEIIEDVCRFIDTFRIAISFSAPHTYISTGPFLPSESLLSTNVFGTWFRKGIKVQRGGLLSWPLRPLRWVGHTMGVTCISYSPDGCDIVSGSEDRTIRIWSADTGSEIGKPLTGHTGPVSSVAYSPSRRHIISGSGDGTIRIWDAETGTPVGSPLKVGSPVRSIAYSPDGRHFISGSDDRKIRVWNAKTGLVVGKPLEGHFGWVRSVAYSPDGRHIISGSDDMTIRVWDAETQLAVRTIRIWNADTGSEIGKPLIGHTGYVFSVAYSPSERHIISGSRDGTIRIWDAEAGSPVGSPHKAGRVRSVAYSPDGRHFISGSDDKKIRVWDAETGLVVGKPLEGHTKYIRCVAYSPDGRHIISGSDDTTIRMWDAETQLAVGEPLEGHAHCMQPTADSSNYWTSTANPIQPPTFGRIPPDFCVPPDPDGWVRDSEGGLLYWVPFDYRTGLRSPALLTSPQTSQVRSVSLDFNDFVFGTSWTDLFDPPQS